MQIAGRTIGSDTPVYVIAEAGVNHNGDVACARRLIDAAFAAGADAVKFQTFRASELVTADAPRAAYQEREDDPTPQRTMLERLELDAAAHRELVDHCRKRGIEFLSTPFDEQSADLLAELDVAAFKIGSGDLTHHVLLSHVANLGRPMLLSTGMATLAEVEAAVRTIDDRVPLALLHCVSCYPTDARDANLRAMHTMAERFGVPVGWSDHTLGTTVSLAAVAIGASILEKHITLDRSMDGPDHTASLEPADFAVLVRDVRTVESALGDGTKQPVEAEAAVAAVARRSVVAARDIEASARIEADDLMISRPGTGLPPAARPLVTGSTARAAIAAGTPITQDMITT